MRLGLNINIGGLGGMQRPQQKQEEEKFKPQSSQRKKPEMGKKISIEEIKGWAIKELSYLLELKSYGQDVAKKIDWTLGFIPEALRNEILRKAKEASGE